MWSGEKSTDHMSTSTADSREYRNRFFFPMTMGVLSACMSVHHICDWCPGCPWTSQHDGLGARTRSWNKPPSPKLLLVKVFCHGDKLNYYRQVNQALWHTPITSTFSRQRRRVTSPRLHGKTSFKKKITITSTHARGLGVLDHPQLQHKVKADLRPHETLSKKKNKLRHGGTHLQSENSEDWTKRITSLKPS